MGSTSWAQSCCLKERADAEQHSISPVKPMEYVLSKLISIAMISAAVALIIGSEAKYSLIPLLFVGVFLGSCLFSAVGLMIAANIGSLTNSFGDNSGRDHHQLSAIAWLLRWRPPLCSSIPGPHHRTVPKRGICPAAAVVLLLWTAAATLFTRHLVTKSLRSLEVSSCEALFRSFVLFVRQIFLTACSRQFAGHPFDRLFLPYGIRHREDLVYSFQRPILENYYLLFDLLLALLIPTCSLCASMMMLTGMTRTSPVSRVTPVGKGGYVGSRLGLQRQSLLRRRLSSYGVSLTQWKLWMRYRDLRTNLSCKCRRGTFALLLIP